MSVVAVLQARLGSSRFPRKVLADVAGFTALGLMITRLSRCELLDEVVVAIPESAKDDELNEVVSELGVQVFRGSESDVLGRFEKALSGSSAEWVVRLTGDCPLIDPAIVDSLIELVAKSNADYGCTSSRFPDGLDVEVMRVTILRQTAQEATDPYDREHVTPFIRRSPELLKVQLDCPEDLAHERLTLDEPEDLVVIRNVCEYFGRTDFSFDDLRPLFASQPQLFEANRRFARNEGAVLSNGSKIWRRAKRAIPGGSMLLSKRSEMFLPETWPAYFDRASGCDVWDLDGCRFRDVGWMGIGTNTLGYGHPAVDEAVRAVITKGNLSTLNCPEEVELAETLCAIHPWAEMARFTRSGGEACAVAVRIGRAASGRDGVAFCGYHGWHDWYLSANLSEDSALDGHLLPGLEPRGVPRSLAGTSRAFAYNDIEAMKAIVNSGEIGVVIMEVERSVPPLPEFLEEVRAECSKRGVVLIFDECTSGFRQVRGGLHLVYGVEPDIAVFGKTLGNGYAINAVIGRASVMQAAQETFISSTFWTERIGPAAALATLRVMEAEDSPAQVHAIGGGVRQRWTNLANEVGIKLSTGGIPALSTYQIAGFDPNVVKTFVIQEMLKEGFLAGPVIYASTAHTNAVLDEYFGSLEVVWRQISACDGTEELRSRLTAGVAHGGFQRLA